MKTRILLLLLALGLAIVGPVAASDLAGHWEGELLGDRRPYRAELWVELEGKQASGKLLLDGRYEFPVNNLVVSADVVRFETNLGGEDLAIELAYTETTLRGELETGGEALQLELHRLPEYAEPRNRQEAWAQDLEMVSTRFLRFDRSFSPAARESVRESLSQLAEQVGTLSDETIIVQLSEIVAGSGNAHTRLYLLRNRTSLRRMPIRLQWFRDGLFVVQATVEHQDVLGCRLERIEGTGVDEAQARVSRLFAGNVSWQRYKGPYFLTSPEILVGLGIATDLERIAYTFQCAGEDRTVQLKGLPLEKKNQPTEAWRDLSPSNVADGWRHVLGSAELPLYLERPEQHYWMQSLPEQRALYFQYNRSQDMPEGESLADFGTRLQERLRDENPSKLVIDLRFNTGGNSGIARELIEDLSAFPGSGPGRRVYVLLGRPTFSAGIYHAAQLANVPGVIFVGEPVGDVLDTWSEGGNLVLPNSGLTVHYTNGYHSYSTREFPEFKPYYSDLSLDDHALDPHVTLALSFAEYRSGIDPVLDAIVALDGRALVNPPVARRQAPSSRSSAETERPVRQDRPGRP